jgi:type III secretion protein C
MLWFNSHWRTRLARAAVLVMLCVAGAAEAAPMPNASRKVSITAREQPVSAFLQDLFAAIDVPAAVSPNLGGAVNGSFSGSAEKVLRDVSRVYNLISYYDGSVMHVVPASDLTRRTFAATSATSERLLREANELGLPDARNTLRRSSDGNMLAVGTKRFVEQLDDMLRAAQATPAASVPGAGTADFRVFYLRYAWAHDVTMTFGGRQVLLPGVASILRSLVGARSSLPIGQEVLLRPTQPGLRGQGLSSQGVSAKTATSAGSRESATDVLVAALARTTQGAEAAPAAALSPDAQQIRIEADQRLNAVIVRDLAERLPRYEQLIAALDVEPQSLEIEATIIDVNTDRARDLGIDWRWNNAGYGLQVGNPGAVAPNRGGIASAVLGSVGQFFARINALQTEGAARVVSSPQVVTLSDVEAVFDNSSTFYVRVAGREQVDLFNVSAGTSLRVTPHVFRDQDRTRIKLMVNVEDGNVTGRSVDQIPVVDRSTINTQALIAEGESLLIGGMVRDSSSSAIDKVPGLGDAPVVGNLFKNTSNKSSRIERMFLITPRLSGGRPATTGAMLHATAAPAPVLNAAAPNAKAAPVPSPAPAAMPTLAPASVPAPTPPAPTPGTQLAAPASQVPPVRASVVLDLDAPLPSSTRPPDDPVPLAMRSSAGKPAAQAASVGTANPNRGR